jgi:ABC-type oligopeptide transport system ATPase subunit
MATLSDNPVVRLTNVFKTYKAGEVDVPAVKGITFTIPRRRFSAIIGPSGSGKTTLLNLIGCLDRPTAGRVIVAEQDVATLTDNAISDFRALKVGFIFQNFSLIPVFSRTKTSSTRCCCWANAPRCPARTGGSLLSAKAWNMTHTFRVAPRHVGGCLAVAERRPHQNPVIYGSDPSNSPRMRAADQARSRVSSFNAANASSGRRSVAAVTFSRRCATDDVPAIRRMFGARRSSHAMAICAGAAWSRCAMSDRVEDWSCVNPPPSGKNGTYAIPS